MTLARLFCGGNDRIRGETNEQTLPIPGEGWGIVILFNEEQRGLSHALSRGDLVIVDEGRMDFYPPKELAETRWPMPNDEKQARQKINSCLEAAGWQLGVNRREEVRITGHDRADYVLDLDRPAAVVEAKRPGKSLEVALQQAQDYACPTRLNVPFIYAADDRHLLFRDLRSGGASRRLRAFHTPSALTDLLRREPQTLRDQLAQLPPPGAPLYRFQQEAVQAVEAHLRAGHRRALVAMATGTGKTITAQVLLHRLLQAGFVRRVLFLVDRSILAEQFHAKAREISVAPGLKFDQCWDLRHIEGRDLPKPVGSFVCTATLQTMINILEEQPNLPVDLFDCVLSDECHRSIYGDWRTVVDGFDAVQIGLTATPEARAVAFFGMPVFSYGYQRAVNERQLVPYEVAVIRTGITMRGLHYTPDEEEFERYYAPGSLEREITVPHRNRLIVETYRRLSRPDQKAIVFAVNIEHANELKQAFDEVYSDQPPDYARLIVGECRDPLQEIRTFATRPYPKVAITVDLLTTGVDIHAVENLVFVRPTRSRVLFEQMMGRGTRLCPDLGKEKFTVFDCVGVVDVFGGMAGFEAPLIAVADEEGHIETKRETVAGASEHEIIRAEDVLDTLEAGEVRLTDEAGHPLAKPDYIAAFTDWVKQHAPEIEALRKLLRGEAPDADEVTDLKERLAEAPLRFTPERLALAFETQHADWLSLVCTALLGDWQERNAAALEAWARAQDWTEEQQKWFGLIRDFLAANAFLRRDDFDLYPFVDYGGWARAAQLFGEARLVLMLRELNRLALRRPREGTGTT